MYTLAHKGCSACGGTQANFAAFSYMLPACWWLVSSLQLLLFFTSSASCLQDRDALVKDNSKAERHLPGGSADYVSDLLQSSYNQHQPGTGEMRHGTEGWQALETCFVVNSSSWEHSRQVPT